MVCPVGRGSIGTTPGSGIYRARPGTEAPRSPLIFEKVDRTALLSQGFRCSTTQDYEAQSARSASAQFDRRLRRCLDTKHLPLDWMDLAERLHCAVHLEELVEMHRVVVASRGELRALQVERDCCDRLRSVTDGRFARSRDQARDCDLK